VLNPPELGELIVRLESARNGTLRASFHTMSPLVRESLESGLSKLTEALKSEGLTLSQAEVHLDFHLGTQGHPGESNPDQSGGSSTSHSFDAETAVDSGNAGSVFERLPDGATISILA
jgi:flagellar hook-length control protein FliK